MGDDAVRLIRSMEGRSPLFRGCVHEAGFLLGQFLDDARLGDDHGSISEKDL